MGRRENREGGKNSKMDMRDQKFGIEIEMTGITRKMAASVIAAYFPNRHNMLVALTMNIWLGILPTENGKS